MKLNKMIIKSHNHCHFWIEYGVLYETYETIRGKRHVKVMDVPGMPDEDFCSDDCLYYVDKEYSVNQ